MRKFIRGLLRKYGYDIMKLRPQPLKIYSAPSDKAGFTYHPTPIGNYYLPEKWGSDFEWMSYNMRRGLFSEPDVIEYAKRFVKPGTTVLDLGANFGQMTIQFAKMVGEKGQVYSFEAQKAVLNILNANIAANDLKNVKVFYNAVYDTDGVVMHFQDADMSIHSSLGSFSINPAAKIGNEIKTLTIDSLNIDKPISFMKIDIQGSDIFAMRGAEQTIRKHKMPIIFEFEQQFQEQFHTSFQDYVDFVNKIDYRFAEVNHTLYEVNYLLLPK